MGGELKILNEMRRNRSVNNYNVVNLFDDDRCEELLTNILKDCRSFLKYKTPLYRGMMSDPGHLGTAKVRKNRAPKDSSKQMQEFFNNVLKTLRLPPRSETLFSTINSNKAHEYGERYLIFPIGKFKYFWFEHIQDLYDFFSLDIEDFFQKYNGGDYTKYLEFAKTDETLSHLSKYQKEVEHAIDLMKNNLKTTTLPKGKDPTEVLVDTDQYYFISLNAIEHGHFESIKKENKQLLDEILKQINFKL